MMNSGIDHEHSEAIGEAARWVLWGERDRGLTIIQQIKARFGLNAKEACQAIAEANLLRARAM